MNGTDRTAGQIRDALAAIAADPDLGVAALSDPVRLEASSLTSCPASQPRSRY